MTTAKAKIFKTFMEWIDVGRGVKKGEKASHYVKTIKEGEPCRVALFEKSQTVKLKTKYVDPTIAIKAYFKVDGYYDSDAVVFSAWDARQFKH